MLAECRMRDYTQQANLYESISIELDEESFLKAFELQNAWTDKPKDENENADCKQSDTSRLCGSDSINPWDAKRRLRG
jgi:gamma-glutamylcysteine synthetase